MKAFNNAYTIKPNTYTNGVTGGEGGQVIHVTNLKDPATCTTYKDHDAGINVTLANIAGDGLPDIWKTERGLDLNTSYGLYDFDLSVDIDGDGVNDNNADICANEIEGILRTQTEIRDSINFVTDTNSPNYIGSFRWALRQTFTRTIVFDVSGAIELHGWIALGTAHDNYTVAGQTAPEGGITLVGNTIIMGGGYTGDMPNVQQCDNFIWRYIRFRNGHYNTRSDRTRDNGMIVNSASNFIIDHCSVSFCNDQGIAGEGKGGHMLNISFQNNIVSECGTGSLIGNQSYGFDIGDIASINNLWVDVDHRAPNIGGNFDETDLQYDLINNLHYNNRTFATNIKSPGKPNLNHIGNYFQTGSSTWSYNKTNTGNVDFYYIGVADANSSPTIYSADNYHSVMNPYDTGNTSYLWRFSGVDSNGAFNTLASSYFVSTPFPLLDPNYTLLTPTQTKAKILADVGANKYLNADGTYGTYIDDFDTEKINKVINNGPSAYADTNQPTTWETRLPIILANQPKNTRPANYYVSNAHIPEAYLDARQADLTAAGVAKTDADVENTVMPSGYTLIGEFIREVDGELTVSNNPIITLNGQSVINLTLGDTYVEQGAIANDGQDGELTVTIDDTALNVNVNGTYQISYSATDIDSNTTTVYRTVNVSSGSKPIISINNEINIASSTNHVVFSEDFTESFWTNYGDVTLEPNSIIAPNGEQTATLIRAANTTQFHNIANNNSVANTTIILRAKKGTLDHLQFIDTYDSVNSVATFDLTNGTASIFSGLHYSNVKIEDIGDGWYKCSVDVGQTSNVHINITNGNNNGNVTLTTNDYLYIWGAEQKETDFGYIYTNGSTVETEIIDYNTVIQGQTYVDDGATAFDPEDGDISQNIVVTNNVNTSVVGRYTVLYDVQDSDGNTATQAIRQVEVIPSTSTIPTITRTDANATTYTVGDSFLGVTGTYSDDDGTGVASVNLGNLDMNVAGVYNVTLFHTDTDNNTGSLIVPITVLADTGNLIFDLTPEQITLGKNLIVLLSKITQ